MRSMVLYVTIISLKTMRIYVKNSESTKIISGELSH